MAITYPISFLHDFPGWSVEFDLRYRQEFSRTAGGVTIAKDLGTPLWQAAFQTTSLRPNELDAWRARLKAAEGGLQRFMVWPISRCFPIAYPKGTDMGDVSAVTVETIAPDNKALSLRNLPAGYHVSLGDYLQIGTKLYQVIEATTADSIGKTNRFEVRPHFAPGTADGDIVVLVRPSVPMIIVSGSLSSTSELTTGRGSISFQAIESR